MRVWLEFTIETKDATVQRISQVLQDSGLYGVIDWTSSSLELVNAQVLAELDGVTEETSLVVRTTDGAQLVEDIEGFLQEIANAHSITIAADNWEVDLHAYVEPEGHQEGEAGLGDHDYEDGVDHEASNPHLFVIYGEAMSLGGIANPSLTSLAHELARDVKSPVTVAAVTLTGGREVAIGYAMQGIDEEPVWVDHRPILDFTRGDFTELSWHSVHKSTAKGLRKLAALSEPAHVWLLSDFRHYDVDFTPIAPNSGGEGDDVVAAALIAQDARLAEMRYEAADVTRDNDERVQAIALADELGLDEANTEALTSLLTAKDRAVDAAEVLKVLGVPAEAIAAFGAGGDPASLPNAVHVEKGKVFNQLIDLPSLSERPSDDSWVSRARRIDFDRPVLGLVLNLALLAAGAALVVLGVLGIGPFDRTWIKVVGFVVGGSMLIDGVASMWVWTKIRLKNRRSR